MGMLEWILLGLLAVWILANAKASRSDGELVKGVVDGLLHLVDWRPPTLGVLVIRLLPAPDQLDVSRFVHGGGN